MSEPRIRAATAGDRAFLLDMLVEACNWSDERLFTRAAVESHPELGRYVQGWPRRDDFGVVAVTEDGALGAAWARKLPRAAPGYGFVAEDVPEISMSVIAAARGRGLGTALLRALIDAARARGVPALSLSVEDGNPAARLYAGAGFTTVGRRGDSDTMLLRLAQPPT